MAHSFLVVNAPTVISEVIDGEAVIMNLASGHYFSCQEVGGEIWSLIEGGTTPDRITGHLLSRYDVEPEAASAALAEFLSELEEHALIRAESGFQETESLQVGDPSSRAPEPNIRKESFRPPTLGVYSDMEDLLLLDPIHDVDETGWPKPKIPA